MTTMTWQPTEAQINLINTMYRERFTPLTPNAHQVWYQVRDLVRNSHSDFERALFILKTYPKVSAAAPVVPVLPALATEAGLYRDPSDGTLYKLTYSKVRNSWETPTPTVAVYSGKSVVRMTTAHEVKKVGKWNRLRAHESRMMIGYSRMEKDGRKSVVDGSKILASWILDTPEKLTEYLYDMCLFCHKPLVDGRSVSAKAGKVCADRWGIPWGM